MGDGGGAQEPAPSAAAPGADPLAAFKTDQGLISLTKVAPELTPVSDYTGDFWNRAPPCSAIRAAGALVFMTMASPWMRS